MRYTQTTDRQKSMTDDTSYQKLNLNGRRKNVCAVIHYQTY